jgi:hypothetical protein
MIRFLKDLYLTGFTVLFRIRPRGKISTRAGRAIGGVTLIEWFILVGISSCIEMLLGKRFLFYFSKPVIVSAFFALFLVNQYVLYIRGHGIKFDREFNNLGKSRKIVLVTSCAVLLVATIALSIYSGLAHRRFIGADRP